MGTWQLFIRHGHREMVERDGNDPLSAKGLREIERLTDYLEACGYPARPKLVLTSPKLRCRQTAEILADWAGAGMRVDLRLDEQGPSCSERDFSARVRDFFLSTRSDTELFCVSHADVLPLLASFYSGKNFGDIKRGDVCWVRDGVVGEPNAVESWALQNTL